MLYIRHSQSLWQVGDLLFERGFDICHETVQFWWSWFGPMFATNKNIAADLGISQRTVENHCALVMQKTGSKSVPALARLALAATEHNADEPRVHFDL